MKTLSKKTYYEIEIDKKQLAKILSGLIADILSTDITIKMNRRRHKIFLTYIMSKAAEFTIQRLDLDYITDKIANKMIRDREYMNVLVSKLANKLIDEVKEEVIEILEKKIDLILSRVSK